MSSIVTHCKKTWLGLGLNMQQGRIKKIKWPGLPVRPGLKWVPVKTSFEGEGGWCNNDHNYPESADWSINNQGASPMCLIRRMMWKGALTFFHGSHPFMDRFSFLAILPAKQPFDLLMVVEFVTCSWSRVFLNLWTCSWSRVFFNMFLKFRDPISLPKSLMGEGHAI